MWIKVYKYWEIKDSNSEDNLFSTVINLVLDAKIIVICINRQCSKIHFLSSVMETVYSPDHKKKCGILIEPSKFEKTNIHFHM